MPDKQKIFLITAIGSFSAKTVIESLKENYPDSTIIGTDIHPAEWYYLNQKLDYLYKVPKAYGENYFSEIIDIINRHQVEFLMPLTDPEVDVLSIKRRELPPFCKLTLSSLETIEIFRDKYKLAYYFSDEKKFKTIETIKKVDFESSKLKFPLIAKKNNGRSSEGIRYIESIDEVETLSDQYILQPIIKGNLITIDLVVDRYGNECHVPRRELLRTANGAGLTVEVFTNNRIENIINTIVKKTNILGSINIELIEADDEYYLMDVNPRFSAGINFTKLAGYDIVENHFKVFENFKIDNLPKIKKGIYVSTFENFYLSNHD